MIYYAKIQPIKVLLVSVFGKSVVFSGNLKTGRFHVAM